MNSNIRSLLSGVSLFSLLAFFAYALTTQGMTADMTVVAFSLLIMHGLASIAIVSYAPFATSRVPIGAVQRTVQWDRASHTLSGSTEWTRRTGRRSRQAAFGA